MDKQRRTRDGNIRLVIAVILLAVFAVVTVYATRQVLRLRDPDTMEWFQEIIGAMGPGGWLLLLLIQYVQIVIAFIPGGPIQIVAGALYGPAGGTAVCLVGTVLATATVYGLVSRYGKGVVHLFVGDKEMKAYRFLENRRRLEQLVVLLFLIPGTPKDALTYLFALTGLPMRRFLLLSTLARMPAVLTSVFAGDRITKGEWMQAGILFLIICGLGLLGFLLHKKILAISAKKGQ